MEECKDYLQPFYYPEEAVRDWCGIPHDEFLKFIEEINTVKSVGQHSNEGLIVSTDRDFFNTLFSNSGARNSPAQEEWPDPHIVGRKYPCYPKRLAILKYEMEIGAIPVGRDGRPVSENDHVAPHRRTVLPEDLKAWMEKKFPNERPAFLFDHLERKELADRKALLAKVEELQSEVAGLNERLEIAREYYKKLRQEHTELKEKLDEYEKPQRGENLHNVNMVKANEKLQNLLRLLSAAIAIYQKNPKLTRNNLAERLSKELDIPQSTINKYWKELESLPHAEELLPPKAGKGS